MKNSTKISNLMLGLALFTGNLNKDIPLDFKDPVKDETFKKRSRRKTKQGLFFYVFKEDGSYSKSKVEPEKITYFGCWALTNKNATRKYTNFLLNSR